MNLTKPTVSNHGENKDISYYNLISDHCDIEVHFHESYEIFQALSPNIRYYVEGKAYEVGLYDLIITNTQEIHRPAVTNNQPYARRYIQFKPHIFNAFFDTGYNPLKFFEERTLGEGNLITLKKQDQEKIGAYFAELQDLFQPINAKKYILAKSKLIEFFVTLDELYRKTNTTNSLKTDSRLLPILEELNMHYDRPFSLDVLSKKYFIDKYYLSHLFKENTGFTLYEYVQTKRIQKAKALIHDGVAISEVSGMCGFSDYSNFFKTFKKLVQLSPSNYRKTIGKFPS